MKVKNKLKPVYYYCSNYKEDNIKMPSGVQSVAWLFCNFLNLKPVAFFIHRCYP